MSTVVKLRPEVKEKWLAALRSGDYLQGHGHLHVVDRDSGADLYCCLGVLCELAVQEGVVSTHAGNDIGPRDVARIFEYAQSTGMPPNKVTGWAYGVPVTDFWEPWVLPASPVAQQDDLPELNDGQRLTFGEIADRIEEGL